jgi:hypothetical protein
MPNRKPDHPCYRLALALATLRDSYPAPATRRQIAAWNRAQEALEEFIEAPTGGPAVTVSHVTKYQKRNT